MVPCRSICARWADSRFRRIFYIRLWTPTPVVLLDPDGHYDGLRRWLAGLVPAGYVAQAALDRLFVTTDVDTALAACVAGQAGR